MKFKCWSKTKFQKSVLFVLLHFFMDKQKCGHNFIQYYKSVTFGDFLLSNIYLSFFKILGSKVNVRKRQHNITLITSHHFHKLTAVSRKPQYKDVNRKTIEILQRTHIFKVKGSQCTLKVSIDNFGISKR